MKTVVITEDTKESVITKANATLTGIITMETKNTKKDTTLIHSHERVDDLNRNGYGIHVFAERLTVGYILHHIFHRA